MSKRKVCKSVSSVLCAKLKKLFKKIRKIVKKEKKLRQKEKKLRQKDKDSQSYGNFYM